MTLWLPSGPSTGDGMTTFGWPRIALTGEDGVAVTFAPRLTEPANRGALAMREAVEAAGWPEVREIAALLG